MNAMLRNALHQYSTVGVGSAVEDASPHRLIQMLMEGALARVAAAMGYLDHGDVAEKGRSIGLAISIVGGLQASLDEKGGGEIAANLDRLYDYMSQRLVEANLRDDRAALEEVHRLLGGLKETWDDVPARLIASSPGAPAQTPG
jgi:flagellar protein FliS